MLKLVTGLYGLGYGFEIEKSFIFMEFLCTLRTVVSVFKIIVFSKSLRLDGVTVKFRVEDKLLFIFPLISTSIFEFGSRVISL